MGVTRRTLLGDAAALAAVAAGVGRADAAEASIRRGGLRPGLNAYTFRDPLTANQSDVHGRDGSLRRGGRGRAALVDTGSYRTADPYADIATAAPRAISWQLKETLGSRLDSPRVDLRRIVRDAGYRGYLPIETLAMGRHDYDPEAGLAAMLSDLREALEAPV